MSALVTNMSADAPSSGPSTATPRTPGLAARVILAWLLMSAMLLAAHWHDVTTGHFPDPDDIMRLVQVRDLLNGQNWFDVHQYRAMPPTGVPMHWSRLVDIPLAGTILLLRPLLGQPLAETMACVLVPLLTLLCAMALIGRLAMRRFGLETATVATLLTGVAAPALYQMQPMRIDHHGWQQVLALAAFNGLFARDPRKGGLVIGLSLACSLSISLENLPLAALFIAVAWLRLLRQADGATWLLWTINSFAAASVGFFLATRGLSDLAQHCDAVSPWHLSVFVLGAAGCSALPALRGRGIAAVLGASVLIGMGAIALMLVQAPECRNGAFAALDPLVRRFWYDAVLEGLPVWRLPIGSMLTLVAIAPAGLFGAIRLRAAATTLDDRREWTDASLLLAGAVVIGLLVARASATACLLAVVPAAWLVYGRILDARKLASHPLRQIGSYLLTALIVLPGIPILAVAAMLPADEASRLKAPLPASPCDARALAASLSRMAPTDIFMPIDDAPQILLDTRDRVVATGHHRGSAGIHDVIAAFISSPAQAQAIVHRRHSTLLLYCPGVAEVNNYAAAAPQGLAAQLEANRTPAWLQPIDLAPGSRYKVYRVMGGG